MRMEWATLHPSVRVLGSFSLGSRIRLQPTFTRFRPSNSSGVQEQTSPFIRARFLNDKPT